MSVWYGIPDMRKDHRCLTACQRQQTQNEPAGQVDIPTRVKVCVISHPGHFYGPQMSHHLSKTIQTIWTSRVGRHCYWSRGLCDGGSRTHVGTTDVSTPIKNNTDRMNQLFRLTFLLGWRSVCRGIPDTGRDHIHPTTCQKQYKHYESAGQVDIPTTVEVCVMGNPRHLQGPQMSHHLWKTTQTEWTSWSGRHS